MIALPPGYTLKLGSEADRPQLIQFMQRHYLELFPGQPQTHFAATVDQYLSAATPLWWVLPAATAAPVACLWLGSAIDQRDGASQAYVLLLYVDPTHRRRGLATALLQQAQTWAAARGDRQISLQVFVDNLPAQRLYAVLGYEPDVVTLKKQL